MTKLKSIFDTPSLRDSFISHGLNERHVINVQRFVLKNAQDLLSGDKSKACIDYTMIKDLPKRAIEFLEREYRPFITTVTDVKTSADQSTTKLVIKLQDGKMIETVIMRYGSVDLSTFPEAERERAERNLLAQQMDTNSSNSGDGASIMSNTTSATRKYKSNARSTVCISSQVGCAMGCKFCATGTMGLMANLSAGEIVEQLVHASAVNKSPIGNIVFMGMGEPLDNYAAVKCAVESFCHVSLFGLSPSKITISTVGVVNRLRQMVTDMPMINLALSLHAPEQELRRKIVPSAKSYALEQILDAVYAFVLNQNIAVTDRAYEINAVRLQKLSAKGKLASTQLDNLETISVSQMTTSETFKKKVMLEYVLLGPSVNCSNDVAHSLGQLLTSVALPESMAQLDADDDKRLRFENNVMLNVIPYNPTIAGVPHGYEPPPYEVVQRFVEIVRTYGIHVLVRQEMGSDIDAACGQLVIQKQTSTESLCKDADIEDSIGNAGKMSSVQGTSVVKSRRNKVKKSEIAVTPSPVKVSHKRNTALTVVLLGVLILMLVRITWKIYLTWMN
ncbi:hypothetical protein MP228_003553 [Amoeboaphelidium protococcarum]|nr:hypothetical protein MP228_003553 [Amoeboaphelidium protococcarum]